MKLRRSKPPINSNGPDLQARDHAGPDPVLASIQRVRLVSFALLALCVGCTPAIDDDEIEANVLLATAVQTMGVGGRKAPQTIFKDTSHATGPSVDVGAVEPIESQPLPKRHEQYECDNPGCIEAKEYLSYLELDGDEVAPAYQICPRCGKKTHHVDH